MFNPLVDSFDNLTDTQIDDKIQELGRKFWMSRNPELQQQISVILDMFKQEAASRRAKAFQKMQENGNNDLDSLINIS
jgi:uncharacterized protein (DUF2342 family)